MITNRSYSALVIVLLIVGVGHPMAAQTCDCTDYLYVNDATANVIHKFPINPSDGSLGPEVGMPWSTLIEEPHGLVSDLNGNLYIANQTSSDLALRKVSCDGTILDTDFTNGVWGAIWNMQSVGNDIYTIIDYGSVQYYVKFDLCDGALGVAYELPTASYGYYWGSMYCEATDRLHYTTIGFAGSTGTGDEVIEIYSIDTDLVGPPVLELSYNAVPDIGTCANTWNVRGIDKDEFGNWYVVAMCNGASSYPFATQYIIKLDGSGNYVSHVTDAVEEGALGGTPAGYINTFGLVEHNGIIYVASSESCVAVFDSGGATGGLTYLPAFEVPLGAFSVLPKAVNITTECCPTTTPVTVDTLICSSIDDDLFLQDLFPCEVPVCEGNWTASGLSGMTFNSCNNSISITGSTACGTFNLSSDGSGVKQCGAFDITFNIEYNPIIAPTISAGQEICEGDTPATLTSDVTSGTMQWQMSTTSCTDGFTDISGATSSSYAPSTLSVTTFYRLVVENSGGNCVDGSCNETSNCVTITVASLSCTTSVVSQPTCETLTGGSASGTSNGGTAPVTYAWSSGGTAATESGLAGGTYTLTVTDANGCISSCNTIITTPAGCCGEPECANVTVTRN